MTVLKLLWKVKFHFLIWVVFGVYLFSASQLYATFFLKNGKPLKDAATPANEIGEVVYYVDELQPVFYDGEQMYMMKGWVFSPGIDGSPEFTKKLVLHSVTRDYIFAATTTKRMDLTPAMPKYNMRLDSAGFSVLIAKDALPRENFKVGFILEDDGGAVRAYRMVDQFVEREPNSLRLVGR